MRHIDANGCQTTEILSLTDYLWHVIQQHCRRSCHTIHTTLRGGWECHIESGNHDAKRWHYRADSWTQLIHKITLDLLPGYWTPPWPLLQYLGTDTTGHRLAALIPGESLAIADSLTPPQDPMVKALAELNHLPSTHIERLLEGISGSAYHLVIRPPTREPYVWEQTKYTIVQRLQHSLEGSTTRAYVSPDRRHHYHQDPHTGLYHLTKQP